jgi:hypothetical protein
MIKEYFFKADRCPTEDIGSAGKIPKNIRGNLDTWSSSLLSLSPEQVHESLVERFSFVKAEFLTTLKAQLLAEKKYSVICYMDDNDHPQVVLAFSESGYAKHYLPPPVSRDLVKARLKELRLEKIEGLDEFVRAFDGLRFMEPGAAGNFEPVASWKPILESDFHSYLQLPKSWDSSVPILTGPNGDQVLLHKANKLNWTTVGSIGMKLRRGGFAEFIADFASGKISDSYSDPGLAKKR